MSKKNILKEKSFGFAVRIVNLYKYLKMDYNEFILSKQIVASGTSVGALIREAEHAESMKDFLHKLNISLKEINETSYWLDLLFATKFINKRMYESLKSDAEELLKLLITSVKTSKQRLSKLSVKQSSIIN